jgi:hypothetical protein
VPATVIGSPQALMERNADITVPVTTQEIAVVVCGGGDPFAEYDMALTRCEELGLPTRVFVGNDMIAHFPGHVDVAGTLHPDKIPYWVRERNARSYPPVPNMWSHRPFTNVTHWTRDWAGSTGLFLVKVAREQGHTHIVLCGVPMTVDGKHFLRQKRWDAAHGFRRGWTAQREFIKRYVRSYSGWTRELFGAPTDEWLTEAIDDLHPLQIPNRTGLKA